MKTQQQWFDEYAVSHQHKTNQLIHYICVPAIFFSIVGLLMSINTSFLLNFLPKNFPIMPFLDLFWNWATVILIILLVFYMKLSFKTFFLMLLFSVSCLVGNFMLHEVLQNYFTSFNLLLYTSLIIFIIAWIGQFYGHHLEGKKPSFLKDLQFLLIGPAWVFEKMFHKTNKQ